MRVPLSLFQGWSRLFSMALLSCVVVVGVGVTPPLRASASLTLKKQSAAEAHWLRPTRQPNKYIEYSVFVLREKDLASGVRTTGASMSRSRCLKTKSSFSCEGLSRVRVGGIEFRIDRDLSTASAEIRTINGRIHRVRWKSDDAPLDGLQYGYTICTGDGRGVSGGLVRSAEARGHVFGERLLPQPRDEAILATGIKLTQC